MKHQTIIIFLFAVVFVFPAGAQEFDEDILIQRFRKNKALDSLERITDKTAQQQDRIAKLRRELVDIDNRLFTNYINENTIESRESRLRLLMHENNRLKDTRDSLSQTANALYLISAIFLVALGVLVYFLIVYYRRWQHEEKNRQALQQAYEADQTRYYQIEDSENELVEDLKNELSGYKEELSKASRFVVRLRNEKVIKENELEELREQHNKLKKDHKKAENKLSKLENQNDEAFEKLKNQKDEAEEKYNELYKSYQQDFKELEKTANRLKEYEDMMKQEETERDTTRQDLLSQIEHENEEMQQFKKAHDRKERELREVKEALTSFLKDLRQKNGKQTVDMNLDLDDKDSIVKNIKALLANKDDDLALTRREKQSLEEEKADLQERLASLEKSLNEAKQDAEEKNELLNTEFSKRQKMEKQLHDMLNHLKGD